MDSLNCCNSTSATMVAQGSQSSVGAWLRRRAVPVSILTGVAIVAAGLALGWDWLVALGIAPVIISLAPCLAMCAVGVCAMGMMRSSPKSGAVEGQSSTIVPTPVAPVAASGGLLRSWLGGRRGLILASVAILAAGLAFGWPWVAAFGIAPVILALAPCAAMCALGLCMMPRGKATAGKPEAETGNTPERADSTPQRPAA